MVNEPTLQDELDKTSIEQLHKVVLQLSTNCFELKKLCVTVLVSAGTLVATFAGWRIDGSILVAGAVVTVFFWLLDSQSYYYQEKLRARMKGLTESLVGRHGLNPATATDGVGAVLTQERESLRIGERARRALFNSSMAFYGMLILLLLLLALGFGLGFIHSMSPQKPS